MTGTGVTVEPGTIVVGVDGSSASAAALRWAATEAIYRQCPVTAVTVWQLDPAVYTPLPGSTYPAPVEEMLEAQEKLLTDMVTEVRGEHPRADVRPLMVEGNPAAELPRLAEHAQLLVVGSHGHNRLVETLLGTVSSRCVHKAQCPVVVIPATLTGPTENTEN